MPSTGAAQMQHFYKDDNMNIFRLPVGWQYLTNNVVGGDLDSTNFGKYDELMQSCLDLGAKVRAPVMISRLGISTDQIRASVLLTSTTMPVGMGRSSARAAPRTTVSFHCISMTSSSGAAHGHPPSQNQHNLLTRSDQSSPPSGPPSRPSTQRAPTSSSES